MDGVGLHFLHVPGVGPDPMPLLLCNGWPSSMVEYLGVLSLLTDPVAHGDDPADSFTVVVPALPGYGFSDRCLDRRPNRRWIADLFHLLMVEQLGYERYVAHGDDIGGGVISRIGLRNPPGLLAVQTASPISPYLSPADKLTAAEQPFVEARPALAGGQRVGRVTDLVWSPRLQRNIGYVWVPADLAAPRNDLEIEWHNGERTPPRPRRSPSLTHTRKCRPLSQPQPPSRRRPRAATG